MNDQGDLNKTGGKAKGGLARAESLSADRRSEIAKKAASARWDSDVPQATHEGEFKIGDSSIAAAVLPDGKRLLTQATFLRALGRSRSPKAGTGVLSSVDGLPFFLQAEALKPFINKELIESTTPLFFREKSGKKSVGYDAKLLPLVAEVYLQMRDSYLKEGRVVPRQYQHIVTACDILMRGLARVGIVALVDEATGYQEIRDRLALQKILDQYLTEEKAKWAKTFPDDFYKKLFRLKGWEYNPLSVKRPGVIGHYTNDIVYDRLAPGVLKKLKELNPKTEKGYRKDKNHQFFTSDYGLPELKSHLDKVMFLMDAAGNNWDLFKSLLKNAAPKQGDSLPLDLDDRR
ncbi:P63C domain-containing protein [Herbaspirillum huttiense]|uniref:P63C domain-containing protein n=1 Tax=Herbaspirillum huttiense subsp. lycopersici TaxID=3074428 RepID=A0ABU2EPX5_9BURK|nr:P63C domain-containing protein [Herbaspirillum huttiense]MDR9850228.1 P63C domain-containing protein [Herbaspirillum huttiense SE1]